MWLCTIRECHDHVFRPQHRLYRGTSRKFCDENREPRAGYIARSVWTSSDEGYTRVVIILLTYEYKFMQIDRPTSAVVSMCFLIRFRAPPPTLFLIFHRSKGALVSRRYNLIRCSIFTQLLHIDVILPSCTDEDLSKCPTVTVYIWGL